MRYRPNGGMTDTPADGRDSKRLNNFDLLRLLAAVAVLVSHSFAVTGHVEPGIGADTLGTIGVLMFFGISGYLITRSWVHAPHIPSFVVKRALRIYPAYIVVLLVTTFIVGPLVSTLSTSDYFSSSLVSHYVLGNASMRSITYDLPGVFAHNPYPHAVNGSIWTLPYEVRAYVIVALLGVCGLLKNRRIGVLVFLVIFEVSTFLPELAYVCDPTLLRAFAAGAIIYLLDESLPWSWWIVALGLVLWIGVSATPLGVIAATAVIPYATIVAAHRTPLRWSLLTRWGDFSYGIYLWAFVVQQLIAYLIIGVQPLAMIAISLPVTGVLAAGSWFLVEERMLQAQAQSYSDTTRREPAARVASNASSIVPCRSGPEVVWFIRRGRKPLNRGGVRSGQSLSRFLSREMRSRLRSRMTH